MTFMELVGWSGALCLAICCAPQSWQSWKEKHSDGINIWLLWLWGVGEVLTLIYVAEKPIPDWPLIFNYMTNIVLLGIIGWYKRYPAK